MGKVARNTSFLFLSELALKIIGVLWVVYLARAFSVTQYGEYNLITSFIAIFSFLPDFGVGIIVIREIAADRKNSASYLGSSFILNGILATVTFLAVIFVAFVSGFSEQLIPLILISGITLVVSTIRSVAIFYFDGVEKMHYSAALNTINTILLIGCAVLGSALGFGLYGVFVGMLVGTVISLIISWTCLLRFIRPTFLYDSKTIFYYLRQGAPLGIAALAALIYTHVDVLVLSKMLGDRAVGIYSAATPFTFGLIQLLSVPFVVAIFPALTRIEKESPTRFRRGFYKSLGVIALWSIPAAILGSILAPVVIPLIFGQKYAQAIPILQILIFSVPFMAFSALLYKVLIIFKKQMWYLVVSVCGAGVDILLNILLIPLFHIYGAVYASILTQIILCLLYGILVTKLLQSTHGKR